MNFSVFYQEGDKGKDNKYPIYIRIFHNKKYAYIRTPYRLGAASFSKDFVLKDVFILKECAELIKNYEDAIKRIPVSTLNSHSVKEVKELLTKQTSQDTTSPDVVKYFKDYIEKSRYSESQKLNYSRTLHFVTGGKNTTVPASDVNYTFLQKMHNTMEKSGVGERGMQVYFGLFKKVFLKMREEYNDEDNNIFLIPNNPFKKFDIPKPRPPKKRNIPAENIAAIKNFPDCDSVKTNIARDVFIISFLLSGTNTADIYSCKRKDDRIYYERQKTKGKRDDNAFISYKIEPELEYYLEKYRGEKFAFNFYKRYSGHKNFNKAVNEGLKFFIKQEEHKKMSPEEKLLNKNKLDLPSDFSSYYARHSWATIARNKCGISKDDIALALNHSSGDTVTDVYLEKDFSIIDKANRKVIDYLISISAH